MATNTLIELWFEKTFLGLRTEMDIECAISNVIVSEKFLHKLKFVIEFEFLEHFDLQKTQLTEHPLQVHNFKHVKVFIIIHDLRSMYYKNLRLKCG